MAVITVMVGQQLAMLGDRKARATPFALSAYFPRRGVRGLGACDIDLDNGGEPVHVASSCYAAVLGARCELLDHVHHTRGGTGGRQQALCQRGIKISSYNTALNNCYCILSTRCLALGEECLPVFRFAKARCCSRRGLARVTSTQRPSQSDAAFVSRASSPRYAATALHHGRPCR